MTLITNTDEVISSLITEIEIVPDALLRTIATTMLGLMKDRIHEKGLAADGSQIGTYSVNPIYVNPKNSPKQFGRPIGKTGLSKFESGAKKGQDHKDRYFDEGYKGFRDAIGRPTDKVNLSLSGLLNNQTTVIATEKGYGIGWQNEELYARAIGFEEKYGKQIWNLTPDELAKLIEIANAG